MKFIKWTSQDLILPILETESGKSFLTSNVLCGGLGIDHKTLLKICEDYADRLSDPGASDVKELFEEYRTELGVELCEGMRLFTVRDMLSILLISQSTICKKYRKQIMNLAMDSATIEPVIPSN